MLLKQCKKPTNFQCGFSAFHFVFVVWLHWYAYIRKYLYVLFLYIEQNATRECKLSAIGNKNEIKSIKVLNDLCFLCYQFNLKKIISSVICVRMHGKYFYFGFLNFIAKRLKGKCIGGRLIRISVMLFLAKFSKNTPKFIHTKMN